VAPAPPCGFGVFTTVKLRKGQKLGEYVGEVRDYGVWVKEIEGRKIAARGSNASAPFIIEELYAAWTGSGPNGAGVVVDAHAAGNAIRFINCSCVANCTFRPFGEGSEKHHRLEVVTLRDIEPLEQLSVDYGWYFDPATLDEVREQAMQAYNEDRDAIACLCGMLKPHSPSSGYSSGGATGGLTATGGELPATSASDAVNVLTSALREGQGASSCHNFFRRFVEPQRVADFLERLEAQGGSSLPEAESYNDIPEAVWALYEVIGATRVGIPCRCALEPSLNASGNCSGIIGRPLQRELGGRDESSVAERAPKWL
jgi:hypothetical protein